MERHYFGWERQYTVNRYRFQKIEIQFENKIGNFAQRNRKATFFKKPKTGEFKPIFCKSTRPNLRKISFNSPRGIIFQPL